MKCLGVDQDIVHRIWQAKRIFFTSGGLGLGSVIGGGGVGALGGGAALPFFCCWRCFLFIFFPAGAGAGGGGARVGFSTLARAVASLAGGEEALEMTRPPGLARDWHQQNLSCFLQQ